jgi:hypothetical protein
MNVIRSAWRDQRDVKDFRLQSVTLILDLQRGRSFLYKKEPGVVAILQDNVALLGLDPAMRSA